MTQNRLEQLFVRKLTAAHANPPTVVTMLPQWPTLLLIVLGALGVAAVAFLVSIPNSGMGRDWPIGLACFVLGALGRDVGIARRAVRLWPIQERYIDWAKVDEAARTMR